MRHGAMARFEDEARVNRAIAQRADQVVLVTTSQKFEQKAFAVIMAPNEIDAVITDDSISTKVKKELKAQGIEVVIA
jgi:DeoR/GlpR family transcriptional regulator of sugar metabolism